jgi:hypothetical protein
VVIRDIEVMPSMPTKETVSTNTAVVTQVMERATTPLTLMLHLPVTTLVLEEKQSRTVQDSDLVAAMDLPLRASILSNRAVIQHFTPTLEAADLTGEPDQLLSRSTRSQIPKNDRVKTLQVVFKRRLNDM